MSDFEDNDNDLTTFEKADMETTIEMEINFYKILAKTTKIEVLSIPDEDGIIISPDELKLVQQECKKQKIKLLYRMIHSNHSTIFDPDTKLTGILPDDNHRGFYC